MSACDTTNKYNLSNLCVTQCYNESTSKFIETDGVNCVTTCAVGYSYAAPTYTCVAACAWPNALYINSTYDATRKLCTTTCAGLFLNRADQNCIASCSYVNSTLTGGNTVCETAANLTNCPYYTYLNSSAYTCMSTCDYLLTGQTCCNTSTPLVASAGSLPCLASCTSNIYWLNGTINQCNATCELHWGKQTATLLSTGANRCSLCANFV
jgi:hypothetical protein